MKTKFLFTILFITTFCVSAVQAQDAPSFSVAGSVDTYYRSSEYAPGTSFANLNGFALGMANIVLSYEGEKSGFVADLVYGPRGADAVFNSSGSSSIVNQLYVYYNLSDGFTLTLGNFNTFLGYEVISPTGNFNYSTSYMFSNGPFSHTGIKADIALSDNASLMLGVLNSTDYTEAQPVADDYLFGAQLGLYGQYVNMITGNGVTQYDFTGGFDLSEDFFLGINGAYQVSDDAGFYGVALYPQLATSETFSIGLRGELFGLHADGADELPSVFATTLTGSYTVENLTIKPEVRLDSWSNAEPYVDNDGLATDSLSAFTIAAIYSF